MFIKLDTEGKAGQATKKEPEDKDPCQCVCASATVTSEGQGEDITARNFAGNQLQIDSTIGGNTDD